MSLQYHDGEIDHSKIAKWLYRDGWCLPLNRTQFWEKDVAGTVNTRGDSLVHIPKKPRCEHMRLLLIDRNISLIELLKFFVYKLGRLLAHKEVFGATRTGTEFPRPSRHQLPSERFPANSVEVLHTGQRNNVRKSTFLCVHFTTCAKVQTSNTAQNRSRWCRSVDSWDCTNHQALVDGLLWSNAGTWH